MRKGLLQICSDGEVGWKGKSSSKPIFLFTVFGSKKTLSTFI